MGCWVEFLGRQGINSAYTELTRALSVSLKVFSASKVRLKVDVMDSWKLCLESGARGLESRAVKSRDCWIFSMLGCFAIH